MKYEVYCITNIKNGFKYIGITTQGYLKRFKDHLNSAFGKQHTYNYVFYRAIRKYGKESFEIKLLEECNTEHEMKEKEKHYIEKHNTFVNNENARGYNMTLGGEGTLGRIQSEETRKKIGNTRKERGIQPWNKDKKNSQKGHWKGKKMPLEARIKMSESKKGMYLGENHPRYGYKYPNKESHPMYGRKHTKESKRRMSENKKGTGGKKYLIIDKDSKEVIEFNLLKELCIFFGVKGHSQIIKYRNTEKTYKGYYIKTDE